MGGAKLQGEPGASVASPPLPAPELLAARARRVRASAQNVPSPCISVCRMNERSGWCEGCYRTLDEIRQWGGASEQARRAVWARIEQRIQPGQT